jgi:hypothetical protein
MATLRMIVVKRRFAPWYTPISLGLIKLPSIKLFDTYIQLSASLLPVKLTQNQFACTMRHSQIS